MTMAIVSVVKKWDIQRVSKFPLTITSQNQFALSNIQQLDIADGLKELLLNKNYDFSPNHFHFLPNLESMSTLLNL